MFNRPRPYHPYFRFVTVLSGVLILLLVVPLAYNHWMIQRDIDGWKTRAQVSSEPNDMLAYMTYVKEGMERWEMTEGYSALIFQTPDNDMSLIYRAVNQHIGQAAVLTTMDRSTPEYQTGLDNLRGSIRELDLHTHEYWDMHQGIGWWAQAIAMAIVFCIAGWLWMTEF